jgi:hypothetical protein
MPLPKPKKDESEEKFMQRCMSDKVMQEEYPDREVRSGVCGSIYDRTKSEDDGEG